MQPRNSSYRQHFSCGFDRGNLVIGIDPPLGTLPLSINEFSFTVNNWPAPQRALPPEQRYNSTAHQLTAVVRITPDATQSLAVTRYILIRP